RSVRRAHPPSGRPVPARSAPSPSGTERESSAPTESTDHPNGSAARGDGFPEPARSAKRRVGTPNDTVPLSLVYKAFLVQAGIRPASLGLVAGFDKCYPKLCLELDCKSLVPAYILSG